MEGVSYRKLWDDLSKDRKDREKMEVQRRKTIYGSYGGG